MGKPYKTTKDTYKITENLKNHLPTRKYWKLRHQFVSEKMGIVMPPSVKIGTGFAIYHINGIVINGEAEFGDNCSVLQQVTVGNSRSGRVPMIGNDCQLLAGAKIIGDVKLGDGSTVGAGAVVI